MGFGNPTQQGRTEPPGERIGRFRGGRLSLGGILFLAITIGVFWYQFRRIGRGDALPDIDRLNWSCLWALVLLLPFETLLSALRMWMICRVLQPDISFRTCVEAELANAGMAILTPSQTGGGAGQMYMLHRGGARMGTALSISLLTFVGTMAALAGMGVVTLLATGSDRIGSLFAGAVVALTLIAALILASLVWPGAFRAMISGGSRLFWRACGRRYPLEDWWPASDSRTGSPVDRMGPFGARLADVLYAYRDDFFRFLRKGKTVFLLTCLVSVAFFFSRFLIAFLCVRFLGIETSSPGEIVGLQMALVFVTYFGPTPGSAGIAEGASLSVMEGIVSEGYAPFYNLLWRFFTAYAAAGVGLFLVLRSALGDLRKGHRRKWRGKAGPAAGGILR